MNFMNKKNKKTKETIFYVQVGNEFNDGVRPEGKTEDFIREITQEHFQKMGDLIEKASNAFSQKISAMARKPKEFTIEFGLNAGGEVGIPCVTKGTVGADFKVILKWELT